MDLKRIALIGSKKSSGGLLAVLSDLLSYDPPENMKVKLFCPDSYILENCDVSKLIETEIVESKENRVSKFFLNKYSQQMVEAIEKFDPDFVFYIAGNYRKGLEKYKSVFILNNQLYTDFRLALSQQNIKLSISLIRTSIYFRRYLRKFDHVIFSSMYSKDKTCAVVKVKDSVVIPFCCNTIFYDNTDIGSDVMSSGNEDTVKLLCIGSIIPYKNQLFVLHAFKKLVKKGYDLTLTLVGTVISKKYYSKCLGFIQDNGLSERVEFVNWIKFKEMPEFIDKFDIYINSSVTDTCGTSAEEGMARGLPVVVSDTGFNREMVGSAGLFYNLNDTETLVNAIEKYLNDKKLMKDMALKGYKKARERTLLDTAREYYEYIDSL